MKTLTLSIVIPAYNESRHIGDCLQAIANQTQLPDEVIVVDNNSTDDTSLIAAKFPFVKVVKEKTQGRAAARNKGFNVSKSDIIGRIDADSRIERNWVERVRFDLSNDRYDAVAGLGLTRTLSEAHGFYSTFWSRVYLNSSSSVFRARMLWGANMAIKRTAWQIVKTEVGKDDVSMHEDQDLSVLLASKGLRVLRDSKLLISTEANEGSYHHWAKYKEYIIRSWATHTYHKKHGSLKNDKAILYPLYLSIFGLVINFLPNIIFAASSYLSSLKSSR